ncbi:ankyrin repeat-containing domain protein [Aspergillus karnatakaensis]|uniref:ankyrin repeat-containing domain protein n=1 Tax=Aspergillus karnatakaensis TaxID=1810916 RepID=UPI003CCD28DC
MPGPDDYTVGWICALAQEYVAAQVCLDEEHDDVPVKVSAADNNCYTLGRIGEHNVVIAVLPEGEYGTTAAASVARDMLHSFPNIRVGLMVGIGGGVPTNHDIRLGDVVVAVPRNGNSGVFHCDFGKSIQNQPFLYTGILDQPPVALRTAIQGLKARYMRKGHRIEESLSAILEENPGLQRDFSKPNLTSDRLFKHDLTHDSLCGGKNECVADESNMVLRWERTHLENNPAIHYGTIASGNRLIKDATVRDKLAAEKDILCFEMEAAGLMNHFPCIVIRGISDYSDSHKNKQWRGYAALTAALYAKDLLYEVSAGRISAEKRIMELLSEVNDTVARTEKAVATVDSKLEMREYTAMLDWFTSFNHGLQLSDFLNKRAPGTGQWFLELTEFKAWLKGAQQTLFCPGIPGSGKSTIASIVVDHLHRTFEQDKRTGVGFAFLDHQVPISDTDLIRGLLKQFIPSPAPEFVAEIYEYHCRKGTRPSPSELLNLLCRVMEGYSRTFIVIDALDEIPTSGGIQSRILKTLFSIQDTACTSLLVTSRQISEIVESFRSKGSMLCEIRARDYDVETFIKSEFLTFEAWIRGAPGLERQITDAVMKAADGMQVLKFLLAYLHMRSLSEKISVRDVLQALEHLPTGSTAYHDAYDNHMTRIKNQPINRRNLAFQVLSWITQARRPVRIAELQHALSVTNNSSEFDEENVPHIWLIVKVSDGLVTVDQARDAVRLAHYTMSQYFERRWTSWFPEAHQDMATILINYLSYERFSIPPTQIQGECYKRLEIYCLYQYAASYWGDHARQAYPQVKELVARFLRCGPKLLNAVQVLDPPQVPFGLIRNPDGVTGLHVAAYFGLIEQIRELIEEEGNPNIADGHGKTALHWALRNGQQEVVKLLLNLGLDANALDAQLDSPLHYCARQGCTSLVKLLVDSGSQLESRNSASESPLLVAARSLNLAALEGLLSNGADVRASDNMDRNALHLAIMASGPDQVDIVKLLLLNDVDFCLCDKDNMTPLHYVVAQGHTKLLDILLEAGADINITVQRRYQAECCQRMSTTSSDPVGPTHGISNAVGLTPLHFAACIGHSEMTEHLLERGADPNARSHHGDTPLHLALMRGLCNPCTYCDKKPYTFVLPDNDAWTDNRWYVELACDYISDPESEEANEMNEYVEKERLAVINALLASPAMDVNIQNSQLESPLHLVKYDKHNAAIVISKLLDRYANSLALDRKGRTALHYACKAGAFSMVETLLDSGCCIDTADYEGLNALHLAVREARYETVRTIFSRNQRLARSFCFEADAKGQTLLQHHLQAVLPSTEMIMLLLDYGARVGVLDNEGNSPLSTYLSTFKLKYQATICRLLLERGADPLWTDSDGRNLAHMAVRSHNSHIGVLEVLSEYGSNLSAKDKAGKGILHHGAIGGSLSMEILTYLRKRDLLNLYEGDKDGKGPLHYAFEKAEKQNSPRLFHGDRWKNTLENLQILVEMESS